MLDKDDKERIAMTTTENAGSSVEQGGKTTFTATLRYESREARDAVLGTPMERGVAKAYDKLAGLLASMPARG